MNDGEQWLARGREVYKREEDKSKMRWHTPPGGMSTAHLAVYRFIPVKYAKLMELQGLWESKIVDE